MVVYVGDDRPRRSFRDDFWDTMRFFSMMKPLRSPRKKAAKRRRVARIKARNGWKKHLRKGKSR